MFDKVSKLWGSGHSFKSNVERIVRAHKGEVSVQSKEGEGTCFTLRFPADAESSSLEPNDGVSNAS